MNQAEDNSFHYHHHHNCQCRFPAAIDLHFDTIDSEHYYLYISKVIN
jgi:hypothetical protein